jgi:molybdate transport system substrate-binding protein
MVLAGVLAACSTGSSGSPGTGPTSTSSPATSAAGSATGGPGSTAVNLTILGAASLKGALEKATAAYEAATPGVTLTVSTDSSAALATQIQQGAPADVFLSADTSNPKKLVDGGFASGAPVVFAGNRLTVIVPKGNPGGVATPADLAKPGLKIIAAGDAVPITKYASQLVSNLAALPGYPAGFAGAYATNVASKEDNVKAIVAKVELGEGDAGIVYVTDAAASSKVATVAVPDAANVPASYSGVVVKASAHADAARAFLDWLAGPDGQAILASFGFLPPPR